MLILHKSSHLILPSDITPVGTDQANLAQLARNLSGQLLFLGLTKVRHGYAFFYD